MFNVRNYGISGFRNGALFLTIVFLVQIQLSHTADGQTEQEPDHLSAKTDEIPAIFFSNLINLTKSQGNPAEEKDPCANGACARASDNEGFVKGKNGAWAVFLFSLLGILGFVGALILLLRFTGGKSSSGAQGVRGADQPNNPHSSLENRDYRHPPPNTNAPTGVENSAYVQDRFNQNEANMQQGNYVPFSSNAAYEPNNQPNYPPLAATQTARTDANAPRLDPKRNYYVLNDDPQPYDFLEKYRAGEEVRPEQSAPRAVLRDATPYKVIEQTSGFDGDNLDAPTYAMPVKNTPTGYIDFNKWPSYPDDQDETSRANRFVRVLPKENPTQYVLGPSPGPSRRF